jgi:hypothetical protein
MRTLTLFFTLCVFLCASPASAKVAAISIEELVAESDEIVVATVTELTPESVLRNQSVFARAAVKRTLKGSLTGTFQFLASPTWTCDSSTAVQGETVLLFLKHHRDHHFVIAHSGRGRMPLRVVSNKDYVTLWSDVRLPSGAPTIEGPEPRSFYIVSVELAYVETLIERHKGTSAVVQQAL